MLSELLTTQWQTSILAAGLSQCLGCFWVLSGLDGADGPLTLLGYPGFYVREEVTGLTLASDTPTKRRTRSHVSFESIVQPVSVTLSEKLTPRLPG